MDATLMMTKAEVEKTDWITEKRGCPFVLVAEGNCGSTVRLYMTREKLDELTNHLIDLEV